jgi:hypothetical protein
MPDDLFSAHFVNLPKFTGPMRNARPIVERELLAATDRLTLLGEREAKRRVRVKTGHGRRSITSKKAVMRGGTAEGRYGTNVFYLRLLEKGRGPIRARNAQALRFVIGGRVLFRKSVGPAPARPFMAPSFAVVKARAPQEYRMAVSRIIRRLGAGA